MATRRMISRRITDSTRFLKMPLTSQALYFHLVQHADDDGIVEAYPIIRSIGANEDDLKLLVLKEFAIPLNADLVTYLPDWLEHNNIRADRKVDSIYKDLLLQVVPDVVTKQAKPSYYSTRVALVGQMTDKPPTNDGIGKDSIGKDSIDNINTYCASETDDTKPEPEAAANTTSSVSKKKASAPNRKEANELFERLWSLYPSKKGKGQVSDRKKAELLKVGYEEMSRAIKRYKECLEKDADWRKPQNGSTFFNSGYIDYLDKNYTGAEDDGMDGSEQRREEMERYADLIPDFPEDADLPFG